MLRKAIISAILIHVFLLVGCENGFRQATKIAEVSKVEAKIPCEKTPFISNEAFWGPGHGKATVNCEFKECFPKDLEASIPCDVRCLFTAKGFGTPESIDSAFEGKRPTTAGKRPHFIVAYGPPASGKSSIIPILTRFFASDFQNIDANLIRVDVDAIFQGGEVGKSYEAYRKAIVGFAPTPELRDLYTQRLYTYFRWVADQISDEILNQALAGRFNVLWETTGASLWPRREIARINSYGYQTTVVYPLVATEVLITRARKRAEEKVQEAAPPEQIRNAVKLAQANLLHLLPDYRQQKRENCPTLEYFDSAGNPNSCRANRVLLIDNSGRKGDERVVFDSNDANKNCHQLKLLHKSIQFQSDLINTLNDYGQCQ